MAAKKKAKPAVKKGAKKAARKVKVEKTLKKTRQVKNKPKKEKKVEKPVKLKAGFEPDYGDILDAVEKRFKLSSNLTDRHKYGISSGCLVQDLILGGGYIGGGMYTNAGAEQSAKSTNIMNFLSAQIRSKEQPGIIQYIDAEGSFDPKYFGNMLGTGKKAAAREIFGVKGEDGQWVIKPRVRYYPDSRGEQIMDALNSVLKRLPDMELVNDKWYYVYENTKENKKIVGDHYSTKMFSKHNKFYVPTDRRTPQAILVVDSWVSLIPEKVDDEDKGAGLGVHGRFFSDNLPKVKSKLRRKNVVLLGVNQLREKPMVQGDPRYEPGGNALKFNSDVRIWQTPRSVPHGSGPTEEEKSVVYKSGTDLYRYIHLQAKKNKLATPFMTGWVRLHVKDPKGQGHGIDKVWDVFQYLKMTGQVSGTRTMKKPTMKVKLHDGSLDFKCDWMQFKALVSLDGDARQAVAKKLGIKKAPNLFAICSQQIRKGLGTQLYYDNLANLAEDDDED